MSASGQREDENRTIADIGLASGRRGVPLVRRDRLDAAGQKFLGQSKARLGTIGTATSPAGP